jgi:hypothetical protein
VRVTRFEGRDHIYIELFAARALARAVVRDLCGVLPYAPGVRAPAGSLGLYLELSRDAEPAPPHEDADVERAGALGIDTRGLAFAGSAGGAHKRAREGGA